VRIPWGGGEVHLDATARGVVGSLTQFLPGKTSVSLSLLRARIAGSLQVVQPDLPAQMPSGSSRLPALLLLERASHSIAYGGSWRTCPGGTRFFCLR